MKSIVHFGLGCVAMAMAFGPALEAEPVASPAAEVRYLPFPDELIREVLVREIVQVCDTETAARLLNEVARSEARSGAAGTGNRSSGADVVQDARAVSGDSVLGQVIRAYAVCSQLNINAINQVTDSTAVTGDAEASNRIDSKPLETVSSRPAIPTSTATRTAGAR